MRRFRLPRIRFIRLRKIPKPKRRILPRQAPAFIRKLMLCAAAALTLRLLIITGAPGVIKTALVKIAGNESFVKAVLDTEIGLGFPKDLISTVLMASLPELDTRAASTKPVQSASPQSSAPSAAVSPTASVSPSVSASPASPAVTVPLNASQPPASVTISPTLSFDSIQIKGSIPAADAAALFSSGVDPAILRSRILIIHTHSSEAYTMDGSDQYASSGDYRTQDSGYNVIRVGDELEKLLRAKGLQVIHDRGVYDYPSYSGSYARSQAVIEKYLKQYPDIGIIIDLHRDALYASDGSAYKTSAVTSEGASSQLMLVVGTDASGQTHPQWRENLKLALRLQATLNALCSGLTRPILLADDRYNQQETRGSLLVEVGSNGNTLQEALRAIRVFADALELVIRS